MNSDHDLLKILIIDDEKHIRQSFADFLEDHDYEVILAENGKIGLELLQSERPDLVLLDLRMPEMHGLEVLRQKKDISPDLPMIVISGANRISDVIQALRYGAWDYLEKPVQDLSILRHSVEKALEKARLVRENRSYQERLESMVKERTWELERSNLHLSNINVHLKKTVEIVKGLSGCLDIKQFEIKLLDEFATSIGASGGSIYLVEQEGLKLMHTLDPGHAPDFLAFPLTKNSIFARVLSQKQPFLIQNITQENVVKSSGWTGYLDGSLLVYPIQDNKGNLISIMTLHSKEYPPFTEQDKEIGSILASYSCEAIRAIKAFDEVREREMQLRQSQKMEAIGTLAGGIAHDFNNILSGIFGYTQLAEMQRDKPELVKKNLERVMQGAGRASELVAQILTFSRQKEYEMKPLQLYLIVKEAMKFLESSIPSTINIVVNINSKNKILADATQMHQIIMNLCTNAYHAMRDSGGTLSVSLCDVMVNETDSELNCLSGPFIELTVEDTGNGIEKKDLERIFDPYFTTKKITQGTGLGLAVVNGIVKKHKGFIKVSSKIGTGTVFRIFFPLMDLLGDQTYRIKPNLKNVDGSERIMLVDDEKDILVTTQEILSNMGYIVSSFMDGSSAFKAFENSPENYDLVITDMTMPNMDGRTLSQKIFSLRKGIPIILCTGFHETFTEEAALQTGIRRYLQKPILGQDLASIIREELDNTV